MAYGCQASLDHATVKLERAAELMAKLNELAQAGGGMTAERVLLSDLASAIAYVADAVRYLKEGVP